jgi:dimeric dUTPase (all-alpha-NTP-PPase superfamily)
MKTVQQKMTEFKQLTHDERYQIVLEMLRILKDGNENFKYVYDNIQTLESPSDHLLEVIYQEIIELAEKKKVKNKELEDKSFQKMKKKIDEIKAQEQAEESKENPDGLLKNIYL